MTAPKLTEARLLARKQRTATFDVDLAGDGSDVVELRLQALGRRAYDTLVDAHPAVDEAKAWNSETFVPALIAAVVVEPELTAEGAAKMWEEWAPGTVLRLFNAALNLCLQDGVAAAGKGSAPTADT